jgi:hypothetical protein
MPATGKDPENHGSHSPRIDASTGNTIQPGGNPLSPAPITRPEKASDQEEHSSNSPGILNGPRIISYNLKEGERPGGMKVRFKIRVETGKKAAALNAQQAQAIKELLQWARQHRTPS